MKAILLSGLLLAAISTACQNAQNEITVSGSVRFPVEGEPVSIILQDGFSKTTVDSIFLNSDNTFMKKVKLPKAGKYMLSGHGQWLYFWGEDEDIEVNLHGRDTARVRMIVPRHIQIENSGPNNELMNLISFLSSMVTANMYATGDEMRKANQSGSQPWIEYMADGYNRNRGLAETYMEYLAKHYMDRNSVLNVPSISPEMKNEIFAYFEKNKPGYPPYVERKEEIAFIKSQTEKLSVGNITPGFDYPAPDGETTLGPENFRGQYLLIDFWASWCSPCRKSIPLLKDVYSKYHDKGFEILSVSIDGDKKAWMKAMDEEKMPWPQALAPQAGKEIQKIYQFNGIPHVLLVDKEGRILARGLHGNKISEEIEKIFNQSDMN